MIARHIVSFLVSVPPLFTCAWAQGVPTYGAAQPNLTDDMGHNGLTTEALFDNAITTNPKALMLITTRKFDEHLFDRPDEQAGQRYDLMPYQLLDPKAVAVMKDIVACALPQRVDIKFKALPNETFSGELGLCVDNDDWRSTKLTKRCRQLVSACLFARVNALHRRVPISFHLPGNMASGEPVLTRPRLAVERSYRESPSTALLNEGTPIYSFSQGWISRSIGMCQPGLQVKLTFASDGTKACDAEQVRVCKGVYGCEKNDASVLPSSALEYSGFIATTSVPSADVSKVQCQLAFVCPSHGAYGVMLHQSSKIKDALLNTRYPAPGPGYPARENQIFTFREAAFFGDVFDYTGLTRTTEVNKDRTTKTSKSGLVASKACGATLISPYQHVYACYSDQDASDIQASPNVGIANLNDRVCASPSVDAKCFPTKVTSCKDTCTWDGSHSYKDCKGDGNSYVAITTYLDDPCSLVGSQQCAVLSYERSKVSPQALPKK